MSPPGSGKYLAPRAPGCPALPTPPHPSLPFWKTLLFPEAAAPRSSVHAPPAAAAGGPSLGRTGPHPGVGTLAGSGVSPYFLQTFLRRRRFGESWAPSGHVATYTGRVGRCVPARGSRRPPSLHLPPHAVTSSWGMGQTAIPESWRGARPGGWGQEAWRGTISPLSSISECIIYEPPHLGAPFAPRASKQVCNRKGRPV